jgi:hypothetical protein
MSRMSDAASFDMPNKGSAITGNVEHACLVWDEALQVIDNRTPHAVLSCTIGPIEAPLVDSF